MIYFEFDFKFTRSLFGFSNRYDQDIYPNEIQIYKYFNQNNINAFVELFDKQYKSENKCFIYNFMFSIWN